MRYVIADTISRMYAGNRSRGYTVTAIHDNVENSTGLVNGIKGITAAAVGGSSSVTRLNNLIGLAAPPARR